MSQKVCIAYILYLRHFTLYLIILLKRYAHGMFAAGRAFVPTHKKIKNVVRLLS